MSKTLRSSLAVMQLFEDLELARLPLGNQEHEAILAFDRYQQNFAAEVIAPIVRDAIRDALEPASVKERRFRR